MTDEDYERFWKEVRPNRRSSPPDPEPNPYAEIPISNNLILGSNHEASFRPTGIIVPTPDSHSLTNLTNAFAAFGVLVGVSFELHHDRLDPSSSNLELVIGDQTIRIESSDGINTVRVFDHITA